MKIYVTHATSFNFKEELYKPLRESKLNDFYNIILPHENSDEQYNSKEELKTCQITIAEVSNPSFGVGIELGWANLYFNRIICIYKKGSKISGSLRVVSDTFIEYEDEKDLIEKLSNIL